MKQQGFSGHTVFSQKNILETENISPFSRQPFSPPFAVCMVLYTVNNTSLKKNKYRIPESDLGDLCVILTNYRDFNLYKEILWSNFSGLYSFSFITL